MVNKFSVEKRHGKNISKRDRRWNSKKKNTIYKKSL